MNHPTLVLRKIILDIKFRRGSNNTIYVGGRLKKYNRLVTIIFSLYFSLIVYQINLNQCITHIMNHYAQFYSSFETHIIFCFYIQ